LFEFSGGFSMANGRGGARAGAGRKPKAQKFVAEVADAERRIVDRLPQLIDNMFLLADGVTVQTVDDEGGMRVYTRPPDRKANEYLINRILGTPTQRIEVDPDPDGDLELNTAALTEASKELAEWRRTQSALLLSLPSAPPTPPTSATST
jgi:hypothetical protein